MVDNMQKRLEYAINKPRSQTERLKAIHDDDLEAFLSSLGLLDKILSGDIKCKFCRDQITLENLQSVFPDSGSISIVCKKELCMRRFMDYIGEING